MLWGRGDGQRFLFHPARGNLTRMEGPLGTTASASLPRAWYGASLAEFLSAEPAAILGDLVANSGFTDVPEQKDAWLNELGFLKGQLSGLTRSLFLEFDIPRMGRRIDAVVLSGPVVFVVEFKVGEQPRSTPKTRKHTGDRLKGGENLRLNLDWTTARGRWRKVQRERAADAGDQTDGTAAADGQGRFVGAGAGQ